MKFKRKPWRTPADYYKTEFVDHLLSLLTTIPVVRIQNGVLSSADLVLINKALKFIEPLPIWLDDFGNVMFGEENDPSKTKAHTDSN